MATVYQTCKMSVVYEVLMDKSTGSVFIFKDGKFYKAPHSLDEAMSIIQQS